MASASKNGAKPSERKAKVASKTEPKKLSPIQMQQAAERKAAKDAKRAERKADYHAARAEEFAAAQAKLPEPPPAPPLLKSTVGSGAPFIYTDELDDYLFELISTGWSLEKISKLENMPSLGTLVKWISTKTHKFSSTYLRAKDVWVPLLEEKALAAAEEVLRTELTTTRQKQGPQGEETSVEIRVVDNIERSRLRLQAYQWTLSHVRPRKHARNAEAPSSGPNEQLEGLFAALKAGPAKTDG